jgi:dephospho-CoA kinase
MKEKFQEFAERAVPAVVLDAALLVEAGWSKLCDKIVFVDAERVQRLQRACQRGWTPDGFNARESAQLSVEEKRKLADGVIDNSGSIDHTFAQVQQFWHSLGLPTPD